MTDKPHPTDARPMPTPVHTGTFGYTADQLRAERIAAWDMGRESMREEAAQQCERLQTGHGNRKGGSDVGDAARRSCAVHIRSMK